ncbi:haloacid dehalogenase-like hydrolase, putative [Trypanosoma cruzi marinkellei]|uniref:Haloacid dehalogenase-like hydrolase, putative n=1 Tax=Trypanosoma cruzi marinkellei TaxID=85056 RepID=K2NU21_TRYCR|nr:haloacid dehalogenase-like hydrolase, putative [Trypanosoma cruzi marinkellei]
MTYRAVVTDLDGTLLNEHHSISEYTAETLRLQKKKGIAIIFATGRAYFDVFHTVEKCGLHGGYLITSNGARVFDPERRAIVTHDMDPDVVSELINIKLENEDHDTEDSLFATNFYRHEEWITNRGSEKMLEAYAGSGFRYKEMDLNMCPHDGIHAVFFTGKHEVLLRVEKILESRFQGKAEHTMSNPRVLDTVRWGVNKGNAMCEVVQLLGINEKETIAFGDGMNDFKMLQMAGKGCVMGNAQSRLKEALPQLEVIGCNTEDGVARKLRAIFDLPN